MYILGVSCYYHDSAAVLLKDGELIAAAEEERFTRIKHDYSFPHNAIKFCLEHAGIKSENLDFVVFHEKPFLKFERIIKTILATFPKSCNLFKDVAITWLKSKLWIKSTIAQSLNIPENKILFSQHHLSHAASAFFSSPFEEAAILTIDGVGEWATTTLGIGKTNKITLLNEIMFPHSLGLLYSVFTAFLGFKVNNGEYKVMGMSAYGKPKHIDKVYQLIEVNDDGSFKLNMKYFSFHYSTTHSFNRNFIKLFGTPREREKRFVLDKELFEQNQIPITEEEIKENRYFADIAGSIQKVTEDILIKIANNLYQKTHLKKLCISGGVALNCVANYKILQNTPFTDIYIQPASGDSGAALGAALYAWHCLSDKKRAAIISHSYWGKEYSNQEIDLFLKKNNIVHTKLNQNDLIEYIAEKIKNGKIVGWFQGRFEWGPRALGNRSILADPRNPKMKQIINTKIKFRESFRPFAPSVLAEHASDFFDIDAIAQQYPAKFMLYTVPSKRGDLIPAVTHINEMSRIQIVKKEDNPLYYTLIEKFYQKTGIPLLLNTSFNLKGEPMVNSPKDAYTTFLRSGIDTLVMGNCIIEK
ncbi:MAG: carbamoyltransferase [Candidatus Saelkia tenebricola]|nr:carbamoyltransferase [Candidatus Saelkia tenebricola]